MGFIFSFDLFFSDVNRPAASLADFGLQDLFWAFSIDFWGKKSQISPKLVQNLTKRAK